MRRFGLLLGFVCAVAVMSAGQAWATNGHQLMGVGVYQNAMGGAVTAAPYDTTTAISNPAGLALIEKRADFNFEAFMPTRTVDFKDAGGQDNQGGSPMYLIPSVGWVGDISDSGDLVFGGGMFAVSGMGVDYDTVSSLPFGARQGDYTPWNANIYSQYQFWKLAPAIAKKINDQLTVGFALNVDYQQMGYKAKFFDTQSSNYMGVDLSRAVGAMGLGASIGGQYKLNDMIQFGATYTSEQAFSDMEYRLSQGDVMFPTDSGAFLMSGNGTYKMKMNFPQQLAFGVAVKPVQDLMLTADLKWINFKSTHDSIDLKGNYALVNPATGQVIGSSGAMPLKFGWKDVMVIAIGAQCKVNDMVTLRAGYNHGNSPIEGEDVFNNLGFPAIVEDHIGIGADFRLTKHWDIGLAYTKAFKKDITGKNDMMGSSSGSKISLEEQSVLLSVSYIYGGK